MKLDDRQFALDTWNPQPARDKDDYRQSVELRSQVRYSDLERLASGGFSEIYLAVQHAAGGFRRVVVLKKLVPRNDVPWSIDEQRQRLHDEAFYASLFEHPTKVQVIDLLEDAEDTYLVMELVHGMDLDKALLSGVLPPRAVVEIIVEVAANLGAINDAVASHYCVLSAANGRPGFVYRDVKPSNLMVAAYGGVKVLDLGIARADLSNRSSRTRCGNPGTISYMAPEQYFFGCASPASDIYTLGAVAVELLTGNLPPNTNRDPEIHASGIRSYLHPLGKSIPNQVLTSLESLLLDMTSLNTENRPDARLIGERAREIAGRLPGPDLRQWAKRVVEPAIAELQERVVKLLDRCSTASPPCSTSNRTITLVPVLAGLVAFLSLGTSGAWAAWALGNRVASLGTGSYGLENEKFDDPNAFQAGLLTDSSALTSTPLLYRDEGLVALEGLSGNDGGVAPSPPVGAMWIPGHREVTAFADAQDEPVRRKDRVSGRVTSTAPDGAKDQLDVINWEEGGPYRMEPGDPGLTGREGVGGSPLVIAALDRETVFHSASGTNMTVTWFDPDEESSQSMTGTAVSVHWRTQPGYVRVEFKGARQHVFSPAPGEWICAIKDEHTECNSAALQ